MFPFDMKCVLNFWYLYILIYIHFPGSSEDKASAYNAGDPGSIPGLGRSPGEGNGNPLQYSCLEKSHGQRSLVGYSLWGRKELDMTERLHFHFHMHTLTMYTVYIKINHQRYLLIRQNTTCSIRAPVPSVTSEMMGCREERGSQGRNLEA